MDGANINKYRSTKQYDSKHHKLTYRKSFLSFRKKDEKHDRQNSDYRGKTNNTRGSYSYNTKRKRVTKKKFLFFKRYKHERETSNFSGGRVKRFFKFNVFNKNKRTTVHKHGLFRRGTEKFFKNKDTNHQLFNPKMHVRI